MARATVTGSAADFIPPRPTLPKLREAAAGCRGCDLWLDATQTVFGEGADHAVAMFVGEQPGDQEDRVGRPFVGPAGRLFDEALESAGIDRGLVYVTNAVKHFKFARQELVKRRLHKKPNAAQVRACNPWLREEIRLVQPKVVVAMGSTAAQALLGSAFRVTQHRGEVVRSEWAGPVIATVHPSSVLRAPGEFRDEARRDFFRDIAKVAEHIGSLGTRQSARPETSSGPARRPKKATPRSRRTRAR
ncbi:MAG TPA: UdgX family uracil-DNA binding protein [Gemmatimonadales bacterium]|nr:UdgX family uracil-DNA binding protein [Gemmatimonadales bacterium]